MLDLNAVPPGEKGVLHLPVPDPNGSADLELTVLVARGKSPGPTLLVLAGVHGDEYEGMFAIHDAFRRVKPNQMRGRLVAVPVTNVPAYHGRTRETPEDGKNMARVFPGRPDGSVTERIAYHVGEALIGRADCLIDLHSSGLALTSPTLIGYCAEKNDLGGRSAAVARAFGAQVIWAHPTSSPGRTLSHARELGIPSVYAEAPGGMRVRPADLRRYTDGVLNVMGHLGIINRSLPPPPTYYLSGNGNIDLMPTFSTSGLFRPSVRVLQSVRENDVIGRVFDLDGTVLEEIRTPEAGRIVFLRAVPAVSPGEYVFLVTPEEKGSNDRFSITNYWAT